jgi:hypothetical protein
MTTALMSRLWGRGLRPLDPLRSIKLKLAVLVAASCCLTALILKKGLDAGFSDLTGAVMDGHRATDARRSAARHR